MSLVAVTKKEFLDAGRSHTFVGLVALFVAFGGFFVAIQWIPNLYRTAAGDRSTLALLNSMRQPSVFFVPLIGLVVGYGAIAGERASGSIKLLLGLPNTRREVFVGKLVGRTAVVAVAIAIGYGCAALVAVLSYDSFAFTEFVAYTLLSMLYAAVCISIAIGFSASTKSRYRALAGAATVYATFLLLWDAAVTLLQVVFVGYAVQPGALPAWVSLLKYLNPSTAFAHATIAVVPDVRSITMFPYLETSFWVDWYGFAVLGLWILVPLALGYRSFVRADLE